MKRTVDSDLRDAVELIGYGRLGEEVFHQFLTRYAYYEDLHSVIDEDAFRLDRGIFRLVGRLYDQVGSLEQEFENTYSETGALLLSGARFSDGTVTGNWNVLRGPVA